MSNKRSPNQRLEYLYKRSGSKCFYCKESILYEDITKDHVLPKSGGFRLKNNMLFACKKCNGSKGNKTIQEFKTYTENKLNNLILRITEKDDMTELERTKLKRYSNTIRTCDKLLKQKQ